MAFTEFTGTLDAPTFEPFEGELDPVPSAPAPAPAASATPAQRRGGTTAELRRAAYVPADDGMRPGEAGAGRGLIVPGQEAAQPLTMKQVGRDLAGGVEQVKALGAGAAAFGGAVDWKATGDTLADLDAVDAGQAPSRTVGMQPSPTGAMRPGDANPVVRAYQGADAEQRAKIRETLTGNLQRDQQFVAQAAEAIKGFNEEQQNLSGKLPDFTDVRTVTDFTRWAVRNGVATAPTMAVSMLGAVAGVPGLMATSGAMAVGDMTSARAQHATAEGKDPAAYIAENAGTTAALAVPYAALDMLGPAGTLATGGAKGLAKQGLGAIAKQGVRDVAGEAINEGGQEVINVAADMAAQERPAEWTGDDTKRVVNAAAVGGLMGGAGHAANTAGSAAGQAREQAARTKKAEQGDVEQAMLLAIEQSPYGRAKSFGFNVEPPLASDAPVDRRKKTNSAFENAAALYGLPPQAVEAAAQAAQRRPLSDVGPFYARFLSGLSRRGVGAPVDQDVLDALAHGAVSVPPPAPDPEASAAVDNIERILQASGDLPAGGSVAMAAAPGFEEVPTDIALDSVSPAPIDVSAHDAATSPNNDRPEPTQAQKEAGNYKVGRARIAGLDISIENPEGSTRRGVDPDGQPWETRMVGHYGYVRRTRAGDGDHSDVFVKAGTPPDYSGPVFVIDQVDPDTGHFDEHKSIIGAANVDEARQLYLANYAPGWQGLGAITELPIAAYSSWVRDGVKRKPLGDINAARGDDRRTPDAGVPDAGGRAGDDAGGGGGAAGVRTGVLERPVDSIAGAPDAGAIESGALPDGHRPDGALTPAGTPDAPVPAPATIPESDAATTAPSDEAAGEAPAAMAAPAPAAADVPGARAAALETGGVASDRFPRVETLADVNVGPAGAITPRPIAPGKALFRETSASGLDDLLRLDTQPDTASVFVTDNPDLAIGQGDNRGVMVEFRPDALSGSEHSKPGTGEQAGREYRTDLMAPRAVQSITMKAVDVRTLRGLTRRRLQDFDREQLDNGMVRFTRKAAAPVLSQDAEAMDLDAGSAAEWAGRLSDEVSRIASTWKNGPPVRVVENVDGLPKEIRDGLRSQSATGNVRALMMPDTGEVYLVADRLPSIDDAQQALFHEVHGHYGLRMILGPVTYAQEMTKLQRANPALAREARQWLRSFGAGHVRSRVEAGMSEADARAEVRLLSVEEALADRAGQAEPLQGFKAFAARLQRVLRALGLDRMADWLEGRTQAETLDLLARSRRAVEEGAAGAPVAGGAAVLSQSAAGEAPVADAPASSAWRDETGRLQFAPGQWLYDVLGRAASPLLVKLQFKAASPELRRQLRKMKLEVQKAQETAVAVAREAQKLSEGERLLVSDIIEKEAAAGTIPPAHAVRLASVISAAMSSQSKELVRLGMLTEETASRWDGAYLPRFYESKLRKQVGDVWADALRRILGRTSTMKGIKGKHLRGRGLFETIPAADLKDYEALGWEQRDPDFNPAVDEQVQVWRDFTREERDAMGEIRDVGFRFVMGYMQTQRDIALGRMFEAMAADPATSSRTEKDGWAWVPDGTVDGTGAKRYGKLAGRFVPAEVLSQLSSVEEAQSAAWQMYRKAMGLWKEGKTVLNPVSHANNVLSNLTMAHFAGVSYHRADKYIGAIRDFATKAPALAEAKDAGLFLGTMSDAELMNTLPAELRDLALKADSKTLRGARFVFNAMTFFLRKPMGVAYQAEDTFFRYLIYRDAREHGLQPQDAVDYAQKYIFTYDDLPKGARMVRDTALPFFSYTFKAVPALLHTALTHPVRFAAPAAVLWGANAASYAIAAGDDDDSWLTTLARYLRSSHFRETVHEQEKLERENLPSWMKGSTSLGTPKAIHLGMDEVTKLPMFLDVSRIIPGGDIFDVSPNAGGVPLPQPITPSHPLFTTAVAMIGNKDLFYGKELVDSNDTKGEATEKRLAWLWHQLAPAIAAGNYHWERGMNALAQASGGEVKWVPDILGGDATGIGRDGLPVQPGLAVAQTFGIKLRPIDLERSFDIKQGQQQKLIREIDAEVRRLDRLAADGVISDRVYAREVDRALEKRNNLSEGLTVDGEVRE